MTSDTQKADQIAYKLYTKLAHVVHDARAAAPDAPRPPLKVDKWFNLETPDTDAFREPLRAYRALSALAQPPPFELQVLLVVPPLAGNEALVHRGADSARVRLEPAPLLVLLEAWTLTFAPTPADDDGFEAPKMYKHGISLVRALYTLLRVLPAWAVLKRLRRRTGTTSRNGNLTLRLRAHSARDDANFMDFDTPPAPGLAPLATDTHAFPAVPHPSGVLALSVTYLTSPSFELAELESLLSSRFFSLDEGPDFTPTLARNPGSLSLGAGAPGSSLTSRRSPPSASVADRFVLPAGHVRTTSFSSGAGRGVPLPPALVRPSQSGGGGGGGGAAGSPGAASVVSTSSRGSAVDSAASMRARRESLGMGRGSELPSAPGPIPVRRPNLNPFKSSTLSSGSPSIHSGSPSLRHPSPLTSPFPPRGQPSPTARGVPPSPIGGGAALGSSAGSGARVPGTLGAPGSADRRSVGSGEAGVEGSPRMPAAKRYSSTFASRYTSTGGASETGASGATASTERPATAIGTVFGGTHTDDDDISAFVQDIDARAPLRAHHRTASLVGGGQGTGQAHDRDAALRGFSGGVGGPLVRGASLGARPRPLSDIPSAPESARPSRLADLGAASAASTASTAGTGSVGEVAAAPMLTRAGDVDARLKEMNDAFVASLAGFGRRRERSGSSASPAPPTPSDEGEAGARGRLGGHSRGGTERELRPPRPRYDSGAGSGVSSVSSQEVLGRLELGDGSGVGPLPRRTMG